MSSTSFHLLFSTLPVCQIAVPEHAGTQAWLIFYAWMEFPHFPNTSPKRPFSATLFVTRAVICVRSELFLCFFGLQTVVCVREHRLLSSTNSEGWNKWDASGDSLSLFYSVHCIFTVQLLFCFCSPSFFCTCLSKPHHTKLCLFSDQLSIYTSIYLSLKYYNKRYTFEVYVLYT